MQNKSKLSKQKNLRATVSESLPRQKPGPSAANRSAHMRTGPRTRTSRRSRARRPDENEASEGKRPAPLPPTAAASRTRKAEKQVATALSARVPSARPDETDKTAPSAPEDPCTQNSPERPPHGRQNPLRPRFRARTPGDLRNRVRGKAPDCEKNRIFEHSVLNADTQSI